MADHKREDLCLNLLCQRFGEIEGKKARIEGRPEDDDALVLGGRPVDAIILRDGEQLAVDHTTVDFLKDQRAYLPWFKRVLVPLEQAVHKALPGISVHISVRYRAVPTGIKWDEQRERITQRLVDVIEPMALAKPGMRGPIVVIGPDEADSGDLKQNIKGRTRGQGCATRPLCFQSMLTRHRPSACKGFDFVTAKGIPST